MSAAPSMARVAAPASRRAFPRNPVNVPLDVITLRSGIPDCLPGRCTDLGEGGIGADVAGELFPGQQLALEIRLPNVAVPLRARAIVRYHGHLHCGLQFASLAAEQHEMLRYWMKTNSAIPLQKADAVEPVAVDSPSAAPSQPARRARRIRVHRRRFYVLLLGLLLVGLLAWWEWQRAWHELETQPVTTAEAKSDQPLRVSSDTMERQITYKVNPAYPEAARQADIEGLVLLDVIVSPDGTVEHARAVAGPDLLAQSALAAVQQWKFQPYRFGGRAVEVETTIGVEFRLK